MSAENNNIEYWKIAAGEGGYIWPEQRDSQVISVGWSDFGSLKKYGNNEEAFSKRFRKLYDSSPSQLWKFYKKVKKHDWVIVCAGSKIFGFGQIIGDYEFRKHFDFGHCRQIEWEKVFWNPLEVDSLKLSPEIKRLFQIRSYQVTVRNLKIGKFSGKQVFDKIRDAIRARPRGIEDLAEWEGLPNAPTSEQETIVLFSKMSPVLRMKISYVSTRYPDAIIRVKEGKKWIPKTAEFELLASRFKAHEKKYRDENRCAMIICWKDDWKRKPRWFRRDITRVIELKKELEKII
jgi:hypothetical protein